MKPVCNSAKIAKLIASHTPTIIVSDCVGEKDPDAELRLSIGVQGYFGMTPTMHHVDQLNTLAFLLADSLTRSVRPSLAIGNIAPRLKAHHYQNGIPFAWSHTKHGHLVVSTAQPEAFAGLKFMGEMSEKGVMITDTKKALEAMVKAGFLKGEFVDHIAHSQFRSLDFQPLLAAAVLLGIKIPVEKNIPVSEIPDIGNQVAYIDRFGNSKLWIMEKELPELQDGQIVKIKIKNKTGKLPFYSQLRKVPDNTLALIVGSSGPHGRHCSEIVINGGNAAKKLKLAVGDKVVIL